MLKFDIKKTTTQTDQSDFHFQGESGDFQICIFFGDSGSGKTTLIRAISGLDNGFKGILEFKHQHWQDSHSFVTTDKRKIGMVFQEPRLFHTSTYWRTYKLHVKNQ